MSNDFLMLSHVWGEVGIGFLFVLYFSLDKELTLLLVLTPPGDPYRLLLVAQGSRGEGGSGCGLGMHTDA